MRPQRFDRPDRHGLERDGFALVTSLLIILVLSLIAKSLLAWQVFGSTLAT